jgi:hypothetical protein
MHREPYSAVSILMGRRTLCRRPQGLLLGSSYCADAAAAAGRLCICGRNARILGFLAQRHDYAPRCIIVALGKETLDQPHEDRPTGGRLVPQGEYRCHGESFRCRPIGHQ